jgi:hypothetical protein
MENPKSVSSSPERYIANLNDFENIVVWRG